MLMSNDTIMYHTKSIIFSRLYEQFINLTGLIKIDLTKASIAESLPPTTREAFVR